MSRGPLFPFALAVSLFAAASAFAGGFSKSQDFRPATPNELAMKSVPSAPGAPAAILDWVRVDDDKNATSTEYVRIKVFSEEGKKYGDVEILYAPGYPAYARIYDLSARTIRADGMIVPFDGKVYDKVVIKGGGRLWRAKAFGFADVQPGSILEYRYTRRWSDRTLFNTLWTLQRDIPIVHAKLTLRPYTPTYSNEFSHFFVRVGVPPEKIVKKGETYELDVEQMAPLPREAFSPPEEVITAHVRFYYTRGSSEPEQFWKSETARQRKKIEGFIANAEMARPLAQKLSEGSSGPMETLKRIYAHAQSMRNFSFEVEKSDQELRKQDIEESRGVDEVLRRNAGFRDEVNRVFVALARAAGFEADVVRVAPRTTSIFSRELPDADQVSAEVAVLPIEGRPPLYLDPGTPYAPFGTVSWEKTAVPAFHVKKDDVKWIEVPPASPAGALTRRTAALRLKDDALEGTITVTFTGQEALTRRSRNSDDDAARKKALEDEVKGWFAGGAMVKTVNVDGLASFDDALTATFDVTLPVVSRAGSRVIVPLSVFAAAAANPFAPATRTNPIYFPHAYRVEDEIRLTMPPDHALAVVPPPAKVNAGPLTYSNEVKENGGEVTFRRTLSVDSLLIERKFYGAVRNFFSSVTAADQQPLVLTGKAQ